jgi:citrate synthase
MGCSTGKDELLETAMALHDVAMKDEYFIKRKLAPNVDFWCVYFILTHYCHYLIALIGGTCFSPQ